VLTKTPREGSLVLYKGHPARVQRVGEKMDILLPGGETAKVRYKDVELLHPGPLVSLADLRPQTGEVQAAWELLLGSTTTLPELAELIYGAYTPATAWATWQLVSDALHFRGTPEAIDVATPKDVSARQAARAAEAAERDAWEGFLSRVRAGKVGPEDARYLRDVEALALGRSAHSRVMAALDREATPENAHALLLKTGYWNETVNPYPARLDVNTTIPALPLPPLPDEPRADLSHLLALAIDDASTDTPDDALTIEGARLWIHVADPAAVALPESELDREARARGASLYLPEATVPMLPPSATDLLGLGLSAISPALSFGLDLDESGDVIAMEIVPSWVRVTRLTYEEADALIAAGEEPLNTLYRLAVEYHDRRAAAGAVMIELPEADVRVRDGEVSVKPVLPLRSRMVVEEAMVRAGEAVAQYAAQQGIPMAYAAQEAPEGGSAGAKPGSLSEMYALRRTLKPRRYLSAPARHAGLGVSAYVQVTSPMRRYLDLAAHQQLRAHLRGETPFDAAALIERIGEVDAAGAGLRQAERLSDQHWLMVYLLHHPGWQGAGVLVEKRGMSGTVLVPELALEARVHLPADLALNSEVMLALNGVDLPRLDPRFRVI
jgi:exoribonuclease-2